MWILVLFLFFHVVLTVGGQGIMWILAWFLFNAVLKAGRQGIMWILGLLFFFSIRLYVTGLLTSGRFVPSLACVSAFAIKSATSSRVKKG